MAGVAVFLLQMQFGTVPASDSLDVSWGAVLAWGFAHHAQWGTQLVFTYGPLGFLVTGAPFDPQVYGLWLALETCIAAIGAALVAFNLARMGWSAAIAFLLVNVVLGMGWISSAVYLISYPLALLLLDALARGERRNLALACAGVASLAAYEALLPLLKFSTFPLWLLWMPCGVVVLWGARNRPLLVTFVASTMLAPLIGWLACGQDLSHLPAFYRWSWEIAAWYGSALQGPPARWSWDAFAWLAIALVSVYALCGLWRDRRSVAAWAIAAMIGATLYLSYKAGLTRADGGHALIFWAVVAWLAVFALSWAWRPLRWHARAAAFVLMLLPLLVLWSSRTYTGWLRHILFDGVIARQQIATAISDILHPRDAWRERMDGWNRLHEKLALPHTVATVGRDSIDLLLHQQETLLMNGLNYTPRPVFQSYSTYSDALARLNERFFLSPDAPKWVLLKLPAIDDRYPTADDGRALVRILQSYRPVLRESGFLLMQRFIAQTSAPDASAPVSLPLSFDAPIALPDFGDQAMFVKFDVGLTAAGKLQALLTRDPVLYMDVTGSDGSQRRYHIPRGIAAGGFMLSPQLRDNDDYLAWLSKGSKFRVASLRLEQARYLGSE
ncbi:MAG: hypothetical protein C4338_06125, partial [Rhodanobacteraceae bacterium]